MDYLWFDLGQQPGGAVVEVSLRGNAANVLLLDSVNYQSYRSGRAYKYFGGNVTRSPHCIPVPNAGHWYIVVDRGGSGGRVEASIRVLPGALPQAI